jgi:glycerol-3-phosphate O-acyltransferase
LGSVVESQRIFIQKNQNNKIFVIPLILGYNFVLEAKYLVNQFLRSTGKEKYVRSKDQYNSYRKILKFLWSLFSEQSEITLSFGEPIDVLGNKVNEEGESIDKDGNIIDLTDYFKWEGNISINTQRETVYTKMLGDAILDSYYRNNVVLASHLVAFAAFRIIMNQNKELSIFEIVNIPNQEIFIPIATFEKVINQLLTVLRKWEKDGKIQLKEELKKETIEIIKTGISNLGTYHPSRPLIFKEDGITTEDLRLVYFYHNRLENYKLHQFIDLGVNKRNGANSEKESLSNI